LLYRYDLFTWERSISLDTIWGVLLAAGFAVPLLLVAASIALVYKVARKLRLSDVRAPRVGVMLAAHAGLIMFAVILGSFVHLGFLELAALVWVPLYLLRRLKRTRAPRATESNTVNQEAPGAAGGVSSGSHPAPSDAGTIRETSRATALRTAWFFGVSGVLLPWLIGLGVKFYLQSQGKPTLPIAGFIDPASVIVLLSLTIVMWSSPFLVLALLMALRFSFGSSGRYSFRYRLPLVWWTYGTGALIAVVVFVPIFWQFDSMLLLVPVGMLIAPPMALVFWVGSRWGRR